MWNTGTKQEGIVEGKMVMMTEAGMTARGQARVSTLKIKAYVLNTSSPPSSDPLGGPSRAT